MNKFPGFLLVVLASLPLPLAAQADAESSTNPFEKELPRVLLETSAGDITLELYADQAPKSVENFLQYVRDDYYDGLTFHRIIPDFMIQGGGFDADLQPRDPREPITNEADNGLSNERGTIAMARTNMPHSATAQFFINVVDNPALDHRGKVSGRTWGYAVFGRVVDGMEIVDEIRYVDTEARGPHQNVPVEPVIIENAEVL
jgi:peptidyl-prolyl cis-trans isomerase B (cyclophilin B)